MPPREENCLETKNPVTLGMLYLDPDRDLSSFYSGRKGARSGVERDRRTTRTKFQNRKGG